MRVALHSVLRAGQEEAYERAHARIAPDLMASLRGVGVQDWAIWRSGRDLFHVVDCDDFDAAMATLADDPVNQRWQVTMAEYVEYFVTVSADGDLAPVPLVWTMTNQLASE